MRFRTGSLLAVALLITGIELRATTRTPTALVAFFIFGFDLSSAARHFIERFQRGA